MLMASKRINRALVPDTEGFSFRLDTTGEGYKITFRAAAELVSRMGMTVLQDTSGILE